MCKLYKNVIRLYKAKTYKIYTIIPIISLVIYYNSSTIINRIYEICFNILLLMTNYLFSHD